MNTQISKQKSVRVTYFHRELHNGHDCLLMSAGSHHLSLSTLIAPPQEQWSRHPQCARWEQTAELAASGRPGEPLQQLSRIAAGAVP